MRNQTLDFGPLETKTHELYFLKKPEPLNPLKNGLFLARNVK